jgi:hypothetical protein
MIPYIRERLQKSCDEWATPIAEWKTPAYVATNPSGARFKFTSQLAEPPY